MSIVYIPSPSELSGVLRFEYETLCRSIEYAIDTRNLDLYNESLVAMDKFYRKHFGRGYV